MDPERLIQCPLVKHHMIRARRFPYHLVKCKESNPEIAKKLATCPFNARHLVPRADLSDHIMKCKDKAFMEQDGGEETPVLLGVWLPLKPRDALQLEPKHLIYLRTAGHCVFSLLEVSRFCEPPQEQLNGGSSWQAPPCDEDWETGEELPHVLPSPWPCPPAPLVTV
uniref:Gametocyte specific factor 1 n=1 Tax=Malurus cyaneus samueli TaxID=2593467 RepID=A0A8C5U7E8_9PASS